MPHSVWVLLMVMALAYGASSIMAVEVGEADEKKVEGVVSKGLLKSTKKQEKLSSG